MAEFEPKDIDLFGVGKLPLVGAFGKYEGELAAALIIATLTDGDKSWDDSVNYAEIMELLRRSDSNLTHKLLREACTNPFGRPDIDFLIKEGFAELGEEGNRAGPTKLTAAAIEKLKPFVRATA